MVSAVFQELRSRAAKLVGTFVAIQVTPVNPPPPTSTNKEKGLKRAQG